MSVIGPSYPPCADCGDTEKTYLHEADGEWVCDEVPECRERQFEQMAERLQGAVDLLEQAVSLIAQPIIPAAARERWQSAVDELLGDGTTGGR